jgi:hypothetical protein
MRPNTSTALWNEVARKKIHARHTTWKVISRPTHSLVRGDSSGRATVTARGERPAGVPGAEGAGLLVPRVRPAAAPSVSAGPEPGTDADAYAEDRGPPTAGNSEAFDHGDASPAAPTSDSAVPSVSDDADGRRMLRNRLRMAATTPDAAPVTGSGGAVSVVDSTPDAGEPGPDSAEPDAAIPAPDTA